MQECLLSILVNGTNNVSNLNHKKHYEIKKSNIMTTLAVSMLVTLVISSQVVIPTASAYSPFDMIQNQVLQLMQNNGQFINNADYPLVLLPANEMAKLPVLDLNNVNTIEQYHNFVDKVNAVIAILNNDKLGTTIPTLGYTQDEYEKISKIVTKYVPLINEYNDMISAAKNTTSSNHSSIINFYEKTMIFSIVLTLVISAAYAPISFELVGIAYRSSGLTTMAFKCPVCVSMVLSEAHWTIRGMLVSTTATVLDRVMTYASYILFPKIPFK